MTIDPTQNCIPDREPPDETSPTVSPEDSSPVKINLVTMGEDGFTESQFTVKGFSGDAAELQQVLRDSSKEFQAQTDKIRRWRKIAQICLWLQFIQQYACIAVCVVLGFCYPSQFIFIVVGGYFVSQMLFSIIANICIDTLNGYSDTTPDFESTMFGCLLPGGESKRIRRAISDADSAILARDRMPLIQNFDDFLKNQ